MPIPAKAQTLSAAQLDQLLGPLALYPDPLLAQMLPAATFPTQIVLANRYVTGGGDPNQIAQQPWDPSVQGVAHYPPLLKWMSDNLNVTTALGQAFLNQQADVMASIQRLRMTAFNLGNLPSTPQQQVEDDNGDIGIDPANPQEIYVPSYEPDQVYGESGNGASFITFGTGYGIGGWLNYDFNWRNDNLLIWGPGHPRPANWWRESSGQRNFGQATVWHPSPHAGAAVANRGDRGWNAERPAAARPVPQAANRPQANGALIGIESSHETRTYSARGQESLHAATPHPAPAPRPPAPREPSHR